MARYFVVLGLIAVAWAHPAQAQQPLRVEGIYPRQLPIGQTTLISLVIPSVDDIQAEISPAQDVTIAKVTRGDNFQGSHTWWAIDVAVAKGAAAGDRTLTLRLPTSTSSPSYSPPCPLNRVSAPPAIMRSTRAM